MERIVTDSLGFRLEVQITPAAMNGRGRHKTYEQAGQVAADAVHTIEVAMGLPDDELAEVAAHEAYHLFYSVRRHITADEETQALVFGQLVKRICALKPNG